MTPITVLTTYIRTQKRWRYASVVAAFAFVFIGVFGFADKSEAFLPLAIAAGITALTGILAVNMAKDQILGGIATIMLAILDALKGLFLIVINQIVNVSRYTQFIDSIPVTRGWEIIRDLCNMFFVLILLAIAIGTILQHEKYTYSKTLPKLISAAILINFSKTIAGLAIDFSNVIMLTFVGAVENTAGGNFVGLLGIENFLNYLGAAGPANPNVAGVFTSLILSFIFMVIALVVVVVMLYILIARVVALWFLVVLSPAAFFLSALPDDKGYGKKWWDQFTNYLIVGPVMMFFLWLSFTTLQLSGQSNPGAVPELGTVITTVDPNAPSSFTSSGIGTALGSPQHTLGTILGIVMLLGSMMVAQQLGVEGGKMAGGVVEGARAWAAGKKGPSPMRWARERFGAYSKMRESARQEKAKRDLTFLAKPPALIAAVGGAVKDMAWRKFMTSEKTRFASDPIRKSWDALYTKPKAAIGRFIERASGDANRHKEEAGEASQNAENNRERADQFLMKKENLKQKQEFIKTQLEELEVVPEDESAADKVKREKSIKELKEKIADIEININIKDLDAKGWRDQATQFVRERSKLAGDLSPHTKADGTTETDEEIKERIGRPIEDQKAEMGQLKDKVERAVDNAKFLEGYKGTLDEAREALNKNLSQEYRDKAIEFDRTSDVQKNKAQGKEALAVLGRVASVVPDMTVGGLKAMAGITLNLAAPGIGLLLPFAPDMFNAMNSFGRRSMREVDDIQMEAIQGSQKHFSSMREQVVKAIANGAMKGYSKIEQMGAQREMINRNLYTSEEIGVARRQYGERGARSAALESFDYNVFNKYPNMAYGMTSEQLVRLLEKNRVNLKDISRADAINGDLLITLNKLGERLGNNVSAKYLMQMKNDPVVENRMQHEAMKKIREMQEKGLDGFDPADKNGGKATNEYVQMIKTGGLTRAYMDNPGFLNIDNKGNFVGDPKRAEFNRNVLREAMKDDDVAPYLALTLHSGMMSNKDSEVMNIISEMLDPNGPNAKMATHVAAALRNMSTQLADRGKANMANISQGVVATMERPVFAKVLLETNSDLALSVGITADNVNTLQFTQEQIDQIKKDMKSAQKKQFKEIMNSEMESNSIWRKLRWGEDRF